MSGQVSDDEARLEVPPSLARPSDPFSRQGSECGDEPAASGGKPPPEPAAGNERPLSAEEWRGHVKELLKLPEGVFPIPWQPPPPHPAGRGRRTVSRWRRSVQIHRVAERAWTSLNETGITVRQGVWSGEVRPCRLKHSSLSRQHRAVWEHLLRESRRLWLARRASFSEMPTGAELRVAMMRGSSEHYRSGAAAPRYVE